MTAKSVVVALDGAGHRADGAGEFVEAGNVDVADKRRELVLLVDWKAADAGEIHDLFVEGVDRGSWTKVIDTEAGLDGRRDDVTVECCAGDIKKATLGLVVEGMLNVDGRRGALGESWVDGAGALGWRRNGDSLLLGWCCRLRRKRLGYGVDVGGGLLGGGRQGGVAKLHGRLR